MHCIYNAAAGQELIPLVVKKSERSGMLTTSHWLHNCLIYVAERHK